MGAKRSIVTMPYVPLTLALTALWFGGSTWWYVCQTQELCESTTNNSVVTSADDTDEVKPAVDEDTATPEEPEAVESVAPVAETEDVVEVEQETPEPAPFDTTRTVTGFFGPNSASFTQTGWEDELRDFAQYLIDTPGQTVEIAGYAAQVDNDVDETNLSDQRAQAMADFLTDEGVPADQVKIVAKAYQEPIGDNQTEAGRAKNRRAVVRFN